MKGVASRSFAFRGAGMLGDTGTPQPVVAELPQGAQAQSVAQSDPSAPALHKRGRDAALATVLQSQS